jgi:hypothetical protein
MNCIENIKILPYYEYIFPFINCLLFAAVAPHYDAKQQNGSGQLNIAYVFRLWRQSVCFRLYVKIWSYRKSIPILERKSCTHIYGLIIIDLYFLLFCLHNFTFKHLKGRMRLPLSFALLYTSLFIYCALRIRNVSGSILGQDVSY